MTRLFLSAALAALCAPAFAATPTAVTANGVTITSAAIDLPGSDHQLPDSPSVELVTNNCISCHSAGMMLTQPALSAKTWGEEVTKMRVVYKAPVDEADVPAIVAYLAAMKIAP